MAQQTHASIIILNWNCKEHIERNIASVLDQSHHSYDVVFVDNGSTDGSIPYLKELESENARITLLETGENLGYVGGNNFGMKYVLEQGKSDYVVILNPDVWLGKDWLKNLLGGFVDEKVGMTTSKIFLYYPYLPVTINVKKDSLIKQISILGLDYYPLQYPNGFSTSGSFFQLPKHLQKDKKYYVAIPYRKAALGEMEIQLEKGQVEMKIGKQRYDIKKSQTISVKLDGDFVLQTTGSMFNKQRMVFVDQNPFIFDKTVRSRYVDAPCGAAMAIRTNLLETLGLFKEKYFMYGDDTELAYRFGRAGYKVRFVHDALCYHHYWGASGAKLTKTQIVNGVRNRLWFIREYFGVAKYVYFWLRAFGKMLNYGLKSPVDEEAALLCRSYARALMLSFQQYN